MLSERAFKGGKGYYILVLQYPLKGEKKRPTCRSAFKTYHKYHGLLELERSWATDFQPCTTFLAAVRDAYNVAI